VPSRREGSNPLLAHLMPSHLMVGTWFVCWCVVRLNVAPILYHEYMPRLSRSWSDDDLRLAVASSVTWGQVARALGFDRDGGTAHRRIRSAVTELNLDTSHFLGRSWNKGTGQGRDAARQRAAKKRWYEENKQVYLDRNKRLYEEKRARLTELKNAPCADCGLRYPPFVMDFDHREDVEKLGNVGALLRKWSWKRLLTEIEKCDIVCANCHRVRSARRGGWSGAVGVSLTAN